jgi:hypothetical protein
MPMFVAPLAGVLAARIGTKPLMVAGLVPAAVEGHKYKSGATSFCTGHYQPGTTTSCQYQRIKVHHHDGKRGHWVHKQVRTCKWYTTLGGNPHQTFFLGCTDWNTYAHYKQ